MKAFVKNALFTVAMVMGGVQAHAELAIQSASQGKISWGSSDSLAKARAVMYSAPGTSYSDDEGYYNPNWSKGSTTAPSSYYAQSKGALVIDALSGQVIYEKNADVARPIASLSKLMTAVVVAESGANMNDMLTINSLDFQTPKKSGSDRLKVGDQLNRAEMLLMMLMKSENPAAKALARTDPMGYDAFISRMNTKARELGMNRTQYFDPSGLDPRNIASPRDIATLARYAYKHNLISKFSITPNREFYVNNLTSGFRSIAARSTNYMVRDGLYSLGLSKTGYIREAGNCVVFETSVGNRPAIVVLLGADDSKTRWQDAENIIANLSMRRFT